MRTFLFSPCTEPMALHNKVCKEVSSIIADYPPLNKALNKLHRILNNYFQFDHILLTFATENLNEGQYLLYPNVARTKTTFLNSGKEQLLMLRNGPRKIIRIGNNEDYGITPGLISQIFPDEPFSVLVLRTHSKSLVCSCSFVSLNNASNYDNPQASLAFAFFDPLMAYFMRRVPEVCKRRKGKEESDFLSITDLPGMKQVTEMVWCVAREPSPILLLGESGTGKEFVAETIFKASARVNGPFIKVNCGGIPDSLIDSELFGHEKGSFTGAEKTRKGFFERAHRGVLLLDEIGELPLSAQTRLLRILQDGILERVGGSEKQRLDIKIVAATHRNLKQMVTEGRFRADLFFRLNVFPISLPPLRERPGDIPVLINFFIKRKCRQYWLRSVPVLDQTNMDELLAYSWPGNIRELNNAVERSFTLWLSKMHMPFTIQIDDHLASLDVAKTSAGICTKPDGLSEKPIPLDTVIKRHIQKALSWSGGKINGPGGAAEILEINPSTLRAKIRKFGL